MKLTPDTVLSARFVAGQREALRAVAGHPFFSGFASVTQPQLRKALLGFYPLIESFPRMMATVLSRIDPAVSPRAGEAREWYLGNIALEERHRAWWIDCGAPLGLSAADFRSARPSVAMEAQQNFLFRIVHEGSVAEAAAALNYAVEGATGEWARALRAAVRARFEQLGLRFGKRALRWVDAHAAYDDKHPAEALEVIKIFASDEPAMTRATAAAIRSLEYYAMALTDALCAQ